MATASEVSVGLAHELAITGCKVGFEPKDFGTLAHSEEKMKAILGVLRGTHEVKPIDHVIDLGSTAQLPFNGAMVEVHRGTGVAKLERRTDGVYLDGKKLGLFRSSKQFAHSIGGHDLRKELEARGNNLSAKVLDHFVAHPELWPEEWKKDENGNTLYVFFWDDIFRNPADGFLYVRYGYWHDGKVVSRYDWLGNYWDSDDPSATLAS